MTEEVQRGVGITIGLLGQAILFISYGPTSLRQDEPYLIGIAVVMWVLILIFGIKFSPSVDIVNDTRDLSRELLSQKLERNVLYTTVCHILLMIVYAFGAGGILVWLFY
jgi:hypothetical protein